MLLKVTFNVAKRDVSVCWSGFAGRETSKEEGIMPLIPSSTNVRRLSAAEAVWMSSSECSRVTSTPKCCGCGSKES